MSNTEIYVTEVSENTFRVLVSIDSVETVHSVRCDDAFHYALTGNWKTKEDLILASINYLLERESNKEILSDFSLRDIRHYFESYENDMKEEFCHGECDDKKQEDT